MRFKEFYLLREASLHIDDPRNTIPGNLKTIEDKINFLWTHCKESWWMFEDNTPLKRATHTRLLTMTTIDPSKRVRESISSPISGVFSEILSIKQPQLPRRFSSAYGTFGNANTDHYGEVVQMILPYDTARFAVTPFSDFLDGQPFPGGIGDMWTLMEILDNSGDRLLSLAPNAKHAALAMKRPLEGEMRADLNQKLTSPKFNFPPLEDSDASIYDYLMRTFEPQVDYVGSPRELKKYQKTNYEVWSEGPFVVIDSRDSVEIIQAARKFLED